MIYLFGSISQDPARVVGTKNQANFLAALLKQQHVSKTVSGGVFQQFITGLPYPHCLHRSRHLLIVHPGICSHFSTQS